MDLIKFVAGVIAGTALTYIFKKDKKEIIYIEYEYDTPEEESYFRIKTTTETGKG